MKIFVLLGLLVLLLAGCSSGYAEIGVDDEGVADDYILIEPIFEYVPSQREDGYSEMIATVHFRNQSEGFYLLVQAYYATLAEIGGDELVFSHIMHRGLYMVSLENMPNVQEVLEDIFAREEEIIWIPDAIDSTSVLRIIYDGTVYDEMPHIMAIDVEIIGQSGGRLVPVAGAESDILLFVYQDFLTRPGGPHEFRDAIWAFDEFLWHYIWDSYFIVEEVYVEEWGSYQTNITERNYPHFWAGTITETSYIDVFVPDSVPDAMDYLIPYIENLLELADSTLTIEFFRFVPVDFTLNQLFARLDELIALGVNPSSEGFVSLGLNRIFVQVLAEDGKVINISPELLEQLENDPMVVFVGAFEYIIYSF